MSGASRTAQACSQAHTPDGEEQWEETHRWCVIPEEPRQCSTNDIDKGAHQKFFQIDEWLLRQPTEYIAYVQECQEVLIIILGQS